MRFSVFFALLVATFIACTSFTAAKSVDTPARRLKGGTQLTAGEEERANVADDIAGAADDVVKGFVKGADDIPTVLNRKETYQKLLEEKKFENVLKQADEMKAKAPDLSKLTPKELKQLDKLTKESEKLENKFTQLAAKAGSQKVPWSKTKKIIVGLGGAGLTAAALYTIYKAYIANGGTASA